MFFFKPSAIAQIAHQVVRGVWSNRTGVAVVAIAAGAVTSALLGTRHLGAAQQLELLAYDQMVRSLPKQELDPRLLIVTITEQDIQALNWPVSDQFLAKAFSRLQANSPKVIGLDLYRDLPHLPGNADLIAELKKPNVVAITNIGDIETGGTPPPPGVPKEQIGFNDLALDPDGVVRRNLLIASTKTEILYSFSLRLALAYLADHSISEEASNVNPAYLQLGKAVFVPLKSNSGGYQKIDAAGYQILLNYRSNKVLARQVTLTQVLNAQVDKNWVKDKIVLIGTTAPSIKDAFYTPYSPADEKNPVMSGVAVHGQMVSQILDAAVGDRPLFWYWSEWAEMLWIAGWATVGGTLALAIRNPLGFGLGVMVMLGAMGGTCFYLFTQQSWIPVAVPAVALVMTGGVVVGYEAYQAQRQQQMVMKLLGQNTSPEIAEALWSMRDRVLKSGKLPGQVLTATMLFTDIKDFSTIAEQMLPEMLLEWLNEFLNSISQEVQAHHGIINKFTGDGLMAVFGVPVPRATQAEIAADALAAVNCALAMGDRVQQLNQQWRRRGLPAIQIRVGICTGSVVSGSLGGKDRLEYGVIGDSVNIASRLESYSKERQPSICRVLIAQETLLHLQGQFQVEPWGAVELKGRRQKVEVYYVCCRSDTN